MHCKRVLMGSVLFCIAVLLQSQNIPDDIKNWLSKSELSKVKKAEMRIDQGEQILFSKQLRNTNDSLLSEETNYLTLSKDLVVDKKTSRALLQAKDYFATGYEAKLEVYKKYIDHFIKSDSLNRLSQVNSLNDSIDIYISDASFYSDKSEVKGSVQSAAMGIHKSNINLMSAVLVSERALLKIINGTFDEKGLALKKEAAKPVEEKNEERKPEVVELPVAKTVDEKVVVAVKPAVKVPVEEAKAITVVEPEVKEEVKAPAVIAPDVYFTVQIMADRKKVAPERMAKVYIGKHPIVENQGDGWYRYSFGKFASYGEAKKAMAGSQTKGYVVAYRNKERISVREAITYFQNVNK